MNLKKTLIIATLAIQPLFASSSSIKIGSIDRTTEGSTYTIGLTSSQIEKVEFSSSSKNPKGKIKIYSIDYFDGYESVSLLARTTFTTKNHSDLSFPLQYLNSYPYSRKEIECDGPCLVIRAEAYHSDDLYLNINVVSTNGDIIGANMISVLAPRSLSTALNSSKTYSIKKKKFVLYFETAGTNPDGSRNYKNFIVSSGTKKYYISNANDRLCVMIGKKLGIQHDDSIEFIRSEKKFLTVAIHSLSAGDEEYIYWTKNKRNNRIDSVTCR